MKIKKIRYAKMIVALSIVGIVSYILNTSPIANASALDAYNKYSGAADNSDGVALSACGSASILSPPNGQLFYKGTTITFKGETKPDAGSEVWYNCWNEVGENVCKTGDITQDITFRKIYNTVGIHNMYFDNTYMLYHNNWPNCGGPLCYNDISHTRSVPYVTFYTGYELAISVAAGAPGKIIAIPAGESPYSTTTSRSDIIMPVPANHSVALEAVPPDGTVRFVRWGGSGITGTPCATDPTNPNCTVPMSKDRAITATFRTNGSCIPFNCDNERPNRCPWETWSDGCEGVCTGGTKNCDSPANGGWKEVAP